MKKYLEYLKKRIKKKRCNKRGHSIETYHILKYVEEDTLGTVKRYAHRCCTRCGYKEIETVWDFTEESREFLKELCLHTGDKGAISLNFTDFCIRTMLNGDYFKDSKYHQRRRRTDKCFYSGVVRVDFSRYNIN